MTHSADLRGCENSADSTDSTDSPDSMDLTGADLGPHLDHLGYFQNKDYYYYYW